MIYSLFISCPKGFEYLLETEVKTLGLKVTRVSPQGVYGEGSLGVAYQICLWSRIANRVQWVLFTGEGHREEAIYKLCQDYPWQTVFLPSKTFAIEFHGTSATIRNSMYGAMVVKDAIVDHFRRLHQTRPSVDKEHPNVKLHAHLHRDLLTVSVDLTGYSLHQRGYRQKQGEAPLKENVAAALLMRANWPLLASQGYDLVDPFCGSGTFVIEAALMAASIAPGLLREDQALIHLVNYQPTLWEKLRVQALAAITPYKGRLIGQDENGRLIGYATENAKRARVASLVHFQQASMQDIKAPSSKGLLVANPPYGERLGEASSLMPLYQELGAVMHHAFLGWQAAIITSNPMLAKAIGLRSSKQYKVFNGPIECKLYLFALEASNQLKSAETVKLTDGALMFHNRLKKNFQHLSKWALRENVYAYRVYDADLPEYAFAIDKYEDAVVIFEYAPPKSIPVHKAEARALEVLQVVPLVLGVSPQNMVVKTRQKQRGLAQYEKISTKHQTLIVREGRAKFQVNLTDYLDTGLFLDHRPMRLKFESLPSHTRFLNCFCYTATASVHAALAGCQTTSVDLSKTYLSWAEDNFRLNQLDLKKHQLIQADCLAWLKNTRERFDVIFMDPPSFSNSKRMASTLDIQRDHVQLITHAMRLLAPGGILYFSTNLRSFKMAPELDARFHIKDISLATIDVDYKRNPKIHYCFEITPIVS